MTELPRAMLIDMDDTILSAYGRPEIAWNTVVAEFADEFAPLSPPQVATAVLTFARRFWSTAEPAWRLKLAEARRQTVQGGFAALAADGHGVLSTDLAIRLADRFTAFREEEMFVFPGAHDAIDALKALGVKLALVTNGAAVDQRAKIERFALAHRFDHIQIEGEHGFGKPEERAYLHAMHTLGVTAPETWMIGASGSMRSGWMRTDKACRRKRPSSPIASSARSPSCCRSNEDKSAAPRSAERY